MEARLAKFQVTSSLSIPQLRNKMAIATGTPSALRKRRIVFVLPQTAGCQMPLMNLSQAHCDGLYLLRAQNKVKLSLYLFIDYAKNQYGLTNADAIELMTHFGGMTGLAACCMSMGFGVDMRIHVVSPWRLESKAIRDLPDIIKDLHDVIMKNVRFLSVSLMKFAEDCCGADLFIYRFKFNDIEYHSVCILPPAGKPARYISFYRSAEDILRSEVISSSPEYS